MAVTNNATVIEDMEGAGPSFTSIGGGQGAGVNTDIFIAGTQSSGRRVDNTTDKGWWSNPGTTFDISGAGEHVKFFFWVTHYPLLTAAAARIGSATSAYEEHTITAAEYPPLGGWFPVWLEVDAGTDSGSPAFASADEFAIIISIGDVGGNAQNLIVDQIHHSTRPVMTWDGATGTFASFASTDATNALGTLIDTNGVYFLYANLQLGSATATTFTDSGVVIVAPEFSHLPSATTWQGIDVDLQHASTVITWTDSVFGASDPAGATRKPDLLVTGTSGTADFSNNRFDGLRVIDFTSSVTMNDGVIANSGVVDLTSAGTNGADIAGTTISGSTVAADSSALIWDVNADPDGELDNTTHVKGTLAHHAIEFGTSSPLTMTVTGWTTSGYHAADGNNDSTFYFADRGSDVTWTVNVIGGTGNFSFKKERAGDTVNIVIDPVTTLINIKDETGANLQNARVLVEAGDGAGDLPFEASVTITSSGTTASVSHTSHGLANGAKVTIRGANEIAYNGIFTISNVTANAYDYTMGSDPVDTATGTITSTGVVVEGLTNASGQISASRSFTVDQNVRYRIRSSTGSPSYKSIPASGWLIDVVDNVDGLIVTQQMTRDGI